MKAKLNPLFPQWVKLCLCGIALTTSASAAEVVKANNTSAMNQTASWEGGVLPTAADTIVFNDIYAQTGTLGTGAPLSYAGIRVEGTTVTALININNTTAANHVAPGAGGIDMSASPRNMTIQALQVNADQTWTIGDVFGRVLTVGGTKLAGDGQITVAGTGQLVIGGTNSLTKGIIVSSARLQSSNASGFGTSAITHQILSDGQAWANTAITVPANFEIAGNGWAETAGRLGAIRLSGATHTGAITLKDHARITAHGSTGTLSGVLGDGGDNFALELGNFNTGTNSTITISGASPNTYSGGTTVTGAIVRGLKDGAFGTGDITVQSNGTATRVTRLQPEGITLNNNIFLSSNANSDFRGALHAAGGLVSTINGTVTIDTPVGNGGHFAAENNTTSVLRLMGAINVAGAITAPTIRIGTVELGGGGNYDALSHFQGTLRLAADQGINSGANLNSGGSGTTTFDLNGFDQTLGRFTTAGFATTIANTHLTDPSTLTLSGDSDSSFGVFAPGTAPLHLVKNGTGTLAVTGSSTGDAPGSLTINSGGLTVGGWLGGSATTVTLADGTTLAGEGTIGGNLALGATSGAKLVIDASTLGSLLVEGNTTVGGVIEVAATGAPSGSPVQVLDYVGTLTAAPANFTAPTFRGASFDVGAGTNSQVTLSYGAPVNLTWTGSVNQIWAAGGDTNWRNPSMLADKFFNSDHVLFTDGAAGAGEITISVPAGVAAGNIAFNNSSKDFRFVGPGTINGLELTKDGTGSVTLATAGTLSGWTDVNAGTLSLDHTNGNPVAGTSGILVEGGATLRLVHSDGGFSFDRPLEGEGTVVFNPHEAVGSETPHAIAWTGSNPSFTGTVVLAQPASGTARITSVQPTTLGGADIVVANGNQLYTANSQTYSNPITLTGFGFADSGGFLGALRLENATVWNGPVTLTGTPGDSGGTSADASIGTFNSTVTINGAIGGGDLLLTGYNSTANETFTLTSANTFGDLIVAASDTPASGQVTGIIGDTGTTAVNTTATLGSGGVYLIGGATGKAAALRIQRADGYTLTQDVIGGGNIAKTVLIADTLGAGLSLGGRTVDIGEQVRLGGNVNGAILNIDPGSVVKAGFVFTGNAAGNSTVLNQTGGSVTVSDHVRVAHWSNETSVWNMTGGSLTITGVPFLPTDGGPGGGSNESPGMLYVGVDGQGIFNHLDGTVSAYGLVLDNRGDTGAGTNMATGIDQYNLTGGTLTLNASGIRGNASSAFNLGGGKLAAAADFTASIPLNLTAAGSTIETAGHIVDLAGGLNGAIPLTLADSSGSGTGRLGFAPAGSVTVDAALNGAAGVRVNGTGSVTLAGANTYTGPTEIWQGTLAITGSLAGTNMALDGGTLATGGSLTGNLTLSPTMASSLEYTGSPLAVTGNVTISGPVEVDPVAAAPLAAGSYPLISYTGSLTGSVASFTLPAGFAPGDFRQAFSFAAGGGNLSLVVTGAAGNLVWNGPGDWDLKTSATWTGGELFYHLDAVTFNDTASDGVVNIAEEVLPVSVVVDNGTLAYTFGGTGAISGTTSLVKQGPGTLTVNNVNGYTGGTLIKGGVLALDPSARLGTGTITISAGTLRGLVNPPNYVTSTTNPVILGDANSGTAETIIEFPGSTTAGASIMSMPVTVSSAAPDSKAIIRCITNLSVVAYYGGPVTLENRDLYFDSAGNQLTGITGKITGTGDLHITRSPGANTRTRLLNNSNDFVGDIYVDGDAMLQIGTGSPSGTVTSIPFGSDLIVAAGARAAATGGGSLTGTTSNGVTTVGGLWGDGLVNSNVSGATTTRLWLGNADKNGVFNGTMSNENTSNRLALTKVGAGTQVLNGVCSFTGSTTISGGVLAINNSFASAVTVNSGGTLSGTGTLASTLTANTAGATVTPGASTGTLTVNGAVNLSNGTLAITIDDATAAKHGKLAAAGTLNITDATLTVTVTGTPNQAVYPLASYGSLTGSFAVTNIPAGYELVTNHEATNQIALVRVIGGDYALWASEFGGFTDTDPASDPDGDGMSNQQEYAFGLNPTSGASVSPILAPLDKTGVLIYTRRNPALTGLAYQVQTSATLLAGSWATDATALQEVIATNGDVQTVRVTLTGAPPAADRLFARVAAAAP